ncbi:MAG: ATP-binding protein [Isosphaeraceae bacterium]
MDALRIVLLTGAAEDADRIEAALDLAGLANRTRRVATRTAFAAALRGRAPDLILAASGPTGIDEAEARLRSHRRWPGVPFVAVHEADPGLQADGPGASGPSAWLMPAILRALQESAPGRARPETIERRAEPAERLFRDLAETLPHLVWTARRGGRCDSVNDRWIRYTGLSHESSRDLGWLTAILPADRDGWRAAWRRAEATGAPFRVECRLRRAEDAADRWHLARALPVRDLDGTVAGWVGTFSDIDDRKRYEADLQASARQHAALAELGRRALEGLEPSALIAEVIDRLISVLGVDRAVVHDLTAGPESPDDGGPWPGMDRARLIGRALEARRPVAFADLVGAAAERVTAATSLACTMAAPIPGPDRPVGVICAAAIRTRPFAAEDLHILQSAAHLIAAARARHQTADDLRTALSGAEAAGRAKDQILALLGHELRTPLTPVLLAVSSIEDDPRLPAELRGMLAMIRRNVEIEAHLIDNLLDASQILDQKIGYAWATLDASSEVARQIELYAGEIGAAGIRAVVEVEAACTRIRADQARFGQIVSNLLSNAIKFTPRGGKVTVRLTNWPGPDRLRIEVADTGIGIEPAQLARLFQPFEQGEGVYTRRYGGLGLGLSIGRTLAEAHGGYLSGASEGPGRGSTFALDLPTIRGDR